jgi:cytochrome P450
MAVTIQRSHHAAPWQHQTAQLDHHTVQKHHTASPLRYYAATREECDKWVRNLRKEARSTNITQYYSLGKKIGRGRFATLYVSLKASHSTGTASNSTMTASHSTMTASHSTMTASHSTMTASHSPWISSHSVSLLDTKACGSPLYGMWLSK